jgi:hypothetical protein
MGWEILSNPVVWVGVPVVCIVMSLLIIIMRPGNLPPIARGILVVIQVSGIAFSLYLASVGLFGFVYQWGYSDTLALFLLVWIAVGVLSVIVCIAGIVRVVRG